MEQPCHCPDPWDTEKINNKSLDPLASTKEVGVQCSLVTNLVTNLSPNLVITKFGDKFCDEFGDKFSEHSI